MHDLQLHLYSNRPIGLLCSYLRVVYSYSYSYVLESNVGLLVLATSVLETSLVSPKVRGLELCCIAYASFVSIET